MKSLAYFAADSVSFFRYATLAAYTLVEDGKPQHQEVYSR
jgi:hypothetical protein